MIENLASNAASSGAGSLIRNGAQASAQGVVRASTKPLGAGKADALTPEQQRQIEDLKRTDEKVRRHEETHLAVGRDLVLGGPSYTYTTGPDKKRYAVSGEVSIDTTPGKTPEETIPKAQHIRATALAPAEPSPEDRRVAALAGRMESEARIELQRDRSGGQAPDSVSFYGGGGQSIGVGSPVGAGLDLFA